MIIADIHLLGSYSGYTTLLSSPGITAREKSALESLGFGQSERASYSESLWSEPAAMGRPLPSGRYALTRALPGERDDAGRTTMLFASLVMDASDWANEAVEGVVDLLNHQSPWRRIIRGKNQPQQLHIKSTPHAAINTNLALVALDRWLQGRSDRRLLVRLPDSSKNSQVVLEILRMLPEKERSEIAWGIRVLATTAPVQLGTFLGSGGGRKCITPDPNGSLSTGYAQAVAHHWRKVGFYPASFIAGIGSTGEVNRLTLNVSDTKTNKTVEHQSHRWWLHGSYAAVALILFFGMTWGILKYTGNSKQLATTPNDLHDEESNMLFNNLLKQYEQRASWSRFDLVGFLKDGERWFVKVKENIPNELNVPWEPGNIVSFVVVWVYPVHTVPQPVWRVANIHSSQSVNKNINIHRKYINLKTIKSHKKFIQNAYIDSWELRKWIEDAGRLLVESDAYSFQSDNKDIKLDINHRPLLPNMMVLQLRIYQNKIGCLLINRPNGMATDVIDDLRTKLWARWFDTVKILPVNKIVYTNSSNMNQQPATGDNENNIMKTERDNKDTEVVHGY